MTSTLTPSDLGLPPRFADFREGQFDIALAAATSGKRFTLLSAPTGTGKSIVYMAASRLLDARTLVLTSTKGLQQQLTHDFGAIGLTDVRGRNNYRCTAVDPAGELSEFGPGRSGHATCDDAPCRVGITCSLKQDGCHYFDAVRRAADANLVVTNYVYWMTSGRHAEPDVLGEFDLLVCDEAHAAPDELADFCSIHIERSEVRALLDLDLPTLSEGAETWVDWATVALGKLRQRYTDLRGVLINADGDRRRILRTLQRMSDLGYKLQELSAAHAWKRGEPAKPDVSMPGMQTDWVAEPTPDGALFSPVWAHAYAEQYLFRGIPRVILVSATLQPAAARYLGIPASSMEFREFASSFDPGRRPLIYVPTTTVDRNMTEGQVRIWLNRIDAIVGQRLDRKGIIHTRSYDRARLIMARSRHSNVMLTHDRRNTRDVIEQFRRSSAPCVLVSPALETGYDFPFDQCRYQIIAKVPFLDQRSLVTQARSRSDRQYSNYSTVLSLIQQTGRGMRAADDMCENFIIDDHIAWLWAAALRSKMIPGWFRSAYRAAGTVPAPPPV